MSGADVQRAADQLLRTGERPTVEKIRATLGTGSPNTIHPLLDVWWKRLSARLDAGPAALHRLPEAVAQVAEALWLQALEEGRRRALVELKQDQRAAEQSKDGYEVRSHVLSLREGEMDARLRDRERQLEELQAQTRTLTLLLQKEQRTRASLQARSAQLEQEIAGLRQPKRLVVSNEKPRGRATKKSSATKKATKRAKPKAVRKAANRPTRRTRKPTTRR